MHSTLSQAAFSPQGTHILADFWGVDAKHLTNLDWIAATLREAAAAANAMVLHCQLHQFSPSHDQAPGVTGVLLLAQSHLSIHTWPEHGMAALDIYVCGPSDAQAALTHLQLRFSPTRQVVHTQLRGMAQPT
jgi:S-adenosylmethionine decarboxylase